jgi:hypothetical protein
LVEDTKGSPVWRMAVFLLAGGLFLVVALLLATRDWMPDGRPRWDEGAAQALVGKTVIIGLTYVDAEGAVDRREQLHGQIVSADSEKGFAVELRGKRAGETYWMPPQPDNVHPAPPGTYRLRSTGEEIVDPDLVSNWIISKPDE